jgi:hypothetical protein
VYTTTRFTDMVAPGVHGGVATVGGRSVSIYEWDGTAEKLTLVWDSGSDMEDKQSMVKGGLCSGCEVAAANGDNLNSAGLKCKDFCPFNSDEAPPKLDDRSDAKGPEPECVTTGVMPDGTRLVFVGMERTGGIQVYDATDPAAPVFQDFLNVRNWMASTTDMAMAEAADGTSNYSSFMIQKALNDGPESLVFFTDGSISPDPILLAVTPLAGRITAYAVKKADAVRADDGSCAETSVCPYIPVIYGGTGAALASVQITAEFTATGDVSDFDEAKKTSILNAFSKAMGLGDTAPDGSAITVVAASSTGMRRRLASVKITCTFIAPDPAAAENAKTLASSLFGSATLLNAFFASNGITGIVATSGLTVVTTVIPPSPPSGATTTVVEQKSDGDDNSLVIGLAVGISLGAIVLCLIVFVCCMIKREKAGKPIFTNLEPRKGAAA